MRPVFRYLPGKSRSDKYCIVPIGDTHIGAKNVDLNKIRGFVKWIKETPNVYWLGMGDYIDAINISDTRRFNRAALADVNAIDDLVSSQVKEFTNIFYQIKDRCLGILDGNHEDKVRKIYHVDPTAWICRDLGAEYLTYETMMRIFFCRYYPGSSKKGGTGTRSIVIYATHGFGGAATMGARINKVIANANYYDADIYIGGHTHAKIGVQGERLQLSSRGKIPFIQPRKQFYAVTGTFLETHGDGYSTYSSKTGYPPTATGLIKILVEPFHQTHWRDGGKQYAKDQYPHIHISA